MNAEQRVAGARDDAVDGCAGDDTVA